MRVLLADDDQVSCHILKETLTRWGFDVITAKDGLEAWDLLQDENAPRLAILDWMMPGMDGIEVCQKIREQSTGPYIYILLLTSKKEKEDIVRGMAAGADDYVSKPFDPQELQMRLKAGKRIVDLQAKLLQAQEELHHMATHDSLSGLHNRLSILEMLERELSRAGRDGSDVAVIVADLDHFKNVNDTLGHLAGDTVLREVAGRLRSNLRGYDAVGRYGGEEFLVVLPSCGPRPAGEIAERLRKAVAEKPVQLPEGAVHVTLSLGVATCKTCSSEQLEAVIRAADAALYEAKAKGRNRVVLAADQHRHRQSHLATA